MVHMPFCPYKDIVVVSSRLLLSTRKVRVAFCPYKNIVVISNRILSSQTVCIPFCLYKDIIKAELGQLYM